jgi:simple sugar transport system ATP-binding protein
MTDPVLGNQRTTGNMPADQTPIIEARDIIKVYPNGVRANKGVNFAVAPGEIHALVGENGAGKSTLMKILYGLETPTSGQTLLRGVPTAITSPQVAIKLGIGMVHQNFMLVPSFTIADNIVLNQEPTRGLRVDTRKAIQDTRALAERYGLEVAPEARVDSVPVGMRQRVEILKALYRGTEILILDEPTAVLTPNETNDLFAAIRRLVQQGKTVIFITHKLREVREISDRVTVMRDGAVIGTVNTSDATERDLARMMVGRDVLTTIVKPPRPSGSPILQVRDLTYVSPSGKQALNHVSFTLRTGEILGIAGVEGNGQTELVQVLTGLLPPAGGTILLEGASIAGLEPRAIRERGIAHIPEDRLLDGVAGEISIDENLIVDRYYRPPFTRAGLLSPPEIHENGRSLIARFGIVARDGDVPARSLSGGNMQKVIVAREFSANPKVLIAAQPTRGVDVGAIEFIHQRLVDQRTNGMAILLISAELQEVMKLADRLLVMYNGRIAAVFGEPEKLEEAEIGLYMAGARQQSPEALADL